MLTASRSEVSSCPIVPTRGVVLVEPLAHDAQVAAHVVDQQLLIGELLARGGRLVVQLRVQRLERVGKRHQHQLQLLRLLLQHPDVGHQLLMLAVGGVGRLRQPHEQDARQGADHDARHVDRPYLLVTTKCARRFLAYASSVVPGSNGNSLP